MNVRTVPESVPSGRVVTSIAASAPAVPVFTSTGAGTFARSATISVYAMCSTCWRRLPKTGTPEDEDVPPDAEVVVIHFTPVPPGGSVRLRIAETYSDPQSYRLEGDEMVFDRSFGRPRNSVVLPAGWYLTASSIPAMVSETPDGRIRLSFVNPRPDEIAVLIKARRRPR